jgi:hypothetical protein
MVDTDAGVIRYNIAESRAMGYCGELEFPLSQASDQFYKLIQARIIRLDSAKTSQGLDDGVNNENLALLEVLERITEELLPVVIASLMEDINQYLQDSAIS